MKARFEIEFEGFEEAASFSRHLAGWIPETSRDDPTDPVMTDTVPATPIDRTGGVVRVGPSGDADYPSIGAWSQEAAPNDRVLLEPATFVDDATHGVLVVPVTITALYPDSEGTWPLLVHSDGYQPPNQKAQFVFGADAELSHVLAEGMRCADGNGALVRLEGDRPPKNVNIHHFRIKDVEMGVMGNLTGGVCRIADGEIIGAGRTRPGRNHGIYTTGEGSLTLENLYIHDTKGATCLKLCKGGHTVQASDILALEPNDYCIDFEFGGQATFDRLFARTDPARWGSRKIFNYGSGQPGPVTVNDGVFCLPGSRFNDGLLQASSVAPFDFNNCKVGGAGELIADVDGAVATMPEVVTRDEADTLINVAIVNWRMR